VGASAPLTHQRGAGLQHDPGSGARSAFLELCGQRAQAALQRQAHAAIGSLLQLMDEVSDDQIATEARRRSGAMQLAPTNPQILRRSIGQAGNLALDLGNVSTARSIAPIAVSVANRRRLA
jgi:hypothetical protein